MKTEVSSENITEISLKAGELMLSNGGETYRTEELVVHTAKALGAKDASSFVTPTVVITSFVDKENRHHSAMRRVQNRRVNLRRLSQVNMLSRRLMTRTRRSEPDVIEGILARISDSSDYPPLIMTLAAAFSSFCFAFVFGGGLKEAVAAFFIGLILRVFLLWFETLPINSFISSICSGALIAVLSGAVVRFQFIPSAATVSTAVLMQVVPGLALVNSIRDLIAGDLVSGTARLMEACMIAAALSVGTVLGLMVF